VGLYTEACRQLRLDQALGIALNSACGSQQRQVSCCQDIVCSGQPAPDIDALPVVPRIWGASYFFLGATASDFVCGEVLSIAIFFTNPSHYRAPLLRRYFST